MKDCILSNDVVDIIYYKLHNLYMKDIVHEIHCKIFKYDKKHKLKLISFISYHDSFMHAQLRNTSKNVILYNNVLCKINEVFYKKLNSKLRYIITVLNKHIFWLFEEERYRFNIAYNLIKKHLIKHNRYYLFNNIYTRDDERKWYTQIMDASYKYSA